MKLIVSLILAGAALVAIEGGRIETWLADMTRAHASTVVIAPGYLVLVRGESVPIWGEDACPTQRDSMTFLGTPPAPGAIHCIVLGKHQQTIAVELGFRTGPVHEVWVVRRRPDSLGTVSSLQRPDGELVRPLPRPA